MNYREEWKLFAELPGTELKAEKINSLISTQLKQTTNQLSRYLWFDLSLKIAAQGVLLLAIILFAPQPTMPPLVVAGIASAILIYYQFRMIKNQPNYDYSASTLVVINKVLKNTRLRTSRIALLVGTTNPMIILAGSYLYYYFKYGETFIPSSEDVAVTLLFMFVGFLINFIAFSMQQNSLLNDLEISNYVLVTDDNSGLRQIASRRKRRFFITTVLMIIGFVLFLLFLTGYLSIP